MHGSVCGWVDAEGFCYVYRSLAGVLPLDRAAGCDADAAGCLVSLLVQVMAAAGDGKEIADAAASGQGGDPGGDVDDQEDDQEEEEEDEEGGGG